MTAATAASRLLLGMLTVEDYEDYLGPRDGWRHQCHAISRQVLDMPQLASLYPQRRVARGSCTGVGGQHSWVVLGADCYDRRAVLLDLTLWSYDASRPVVWTGTYRDGLHQPHGDGLIWKWGKPAAGDGEPLTLTPSRPFSPAARRFLDMLGPLDRRGWAMLAHAPVGGWPAAEVFAAMAEHPVIAPHIPIDMLGMLTDADPGGLYLPTAAS